MFHYRTLAPWRPYTGPTMVGRQKTLMIRTLLVAATAWCVIVPGPAVPPPPGSPQAPDPLAARTRGRSDAPVTVYEMSDFQCPYCREFALGTLPLLEREQYAYLLYRGRPARGRGTDHGLPGRAGLDLPEQDGDAPLMGRPSFIYRLSIGLAHRALPFAARFDKKLARGLDARRGVTDRLSAWARAHRDPKRPLLWVHASSVGEGLQAKPVLEAVRAEAPHWQLAYTFFSPSAERLARSLPVDVADYLPLDRPAEVRAALEALRPAALVFSKLDVWPELTLAAAQRGVKLGLISATVAPHSSRLRWPARGWAEPAYRALERIGTISEEDGRRLEQLGARPSAIEVTGDTRYDSVAERAERFDRTRDPFARLAIAP